MLYLLLSKTRKKKTNRQLWVRQTPFVPAGDPIWAPKQLQTTLNRGVKKKTLSVRLEQLQPPSHPPQPFHLSSAAWCAKEPDVSSSLHSRAISSSGSRSEQTETCRLPSPWAGGGKPLLLPAEQTADVRKWSGQSAEGYALRLCFWGHNGRKLAASCFEVHTSSVSFISI